MVEKNKSIDGLSLPGPMDGLNIIESAAELVYRLGGVLMPVLVGMKGDPKMGLPEKWNLHMIAYCIPIPEQALVEAEAERIEAEQSEASEDSLSAKEKLFKLWMGETEEEE